MNLRLYFTLAALSCLATMHGAIFLHNRGLAALPLPAQDLLGWVVLGLVGGMLLFTTSCARHLTRLALILSALSTTLFTMAHVEFGHLFWGLGFCFSSMLLPPLLRQVLDLSTRPALHLGVALGVADCFWNFFYVLPNPSNTAVLVGLLVLLQAGAGVLCALGKPEEATWDTEVFSAPPPLGLLPLLCLMAVMFFIFSIMAMSPQTLEEHGPVIPRVLSLYLWLAYPLMGILLDWKGSGMRVLAMCMAGTVLGASGCWLLVGALPYGLFYAVVLACRMAAVICLIMLFWRTVPRGAAWEMSAGLPYILMLSALWFQAYMNVAAWHSGHFALVGILSGGLFLYCCVRLQPLLAQMQEMPPLADEKRREVRPQYTQETLESFVEKHHITAREQDVLRLIMDGLDTTSIGQALYLSDNTIKTHVRQLLRKTKTRNRIALVALFFNETGGRTEDAQGAASQPTHPFG